MIKTKMFLIFKFDHLNRNSERIPRSLLRGLASELQQINPFLAWKIPCTLVQGASICFGFRSSDLNQKCKYFWRDLKPYPIRMDRLPSRERRSQGFFESTRSQGPSVQTAIACRFYCRGSHQGDIDSKWSMAEYAASLILLPRSYSWFAVP